MLRNKLVRSDGRIIDSSVIISCEFTEDVNSGTNLTVGDVTSSELSLEIRSTEAIQQGEVLTYYMIEDDVETLIGEFIAEKPTVASKTSIKFSAYDNIVKTEKVFSGWLLDNQGAFPMTLLSLVQSACDYCDVTLATPDFPMYDLSVGAFYADDITCRQVLSWAAAISGRFVRANSDGEIEFAWYQPATLVTVTPGKYANAANLDISDDGRGNVSIVSNDMTLTDDGKGHVVIEIANVVISEVDGNVTISAHTIPYKSGGLSYETYITDPIDKVQIKQSSNDVGVSYPDVEGNCFPVSNNMILGTLETSTLTTVATHLFEHLRDVAYVPVSINCLGTIQVRAGDIIAVRDSEGNEMTTYVMKVSVSASGTTISSTGDKSYGSNASVASEKYTNLTGKVLEISKTIDGLTIANKDLNGRVGSLELSTDAFKVKIQEDVDKLAEVTMTSDQVAIKISEAVDAIDSVKTSTGYTFDANGLNIHKDGEEMDNTLDNNGMYVRRGKDDILTADSTGVNAINLTARRFLVIGEYSRFEDYNRSTGKRTACFWIGG